MLETVTSMKTSEARDILAETARKGDAEKRGRKASKEVRQLQLIEATIDSLAKRGYAETTMADVAVRDRNPWYREVARGELERLKGPLYQTAAAAVGAAYVDKNIRTWEAMQKVLDSGEHRPTHLRGWKPDAIG
jgi:uncharacterized protein YdaT